MRQNLSQSQSILLQEADGTALVYADKAAFLGAGWDIVFLGDDGTALATQPDWDIYPSGVEADVYIITYAAPSAADSPWTAVVEIPGDNFVTPASWSERSTVQDVDTIFARMATSGTISTAGRTVSTVELFQGDSLRTQVSISEAMLSEIGADSLADLDSFSGGVKLNSTAGDAVPDVLLDSLTVVSDTAGSRIMLAILEDYPGVFDIEGARSEQINGRLDIRITKGSVTKIGATVDIRAAWSARP